MRKLFGTDGIRGQANRFPVTPEIALQVGKAMAHVFHAAGHGSKRVVIGKDTRLSGYMLETALTSGLVSMGMDVFLVGPIPTPGVAHLTRSMNATVGIMLTASHNPFDDNGIKIFDANGYKLSDEIEGQIEKLVISQEIGSEHIRSDNLGKAFRIDDARGRYIEFAKSTISNQSLTGLKIVLDCANGASYLIGPWIFKELGADVIKVAAAPDGYNINNGCGALYPEHISALVQEHHADVGIAFDGDADRVLFCDADGTPVDGDRILAMCALDFKQRDKLARDTLVVTTMSNLGLHDAMRANGIRTVTTKVGDRYVIERMRSEGYNLGGEKAGHLVFMDYVTTGDGIISALQVLKLMQQSGKPLSDLAACMDEYPQKLVSVEVREKKPLGELVETSRAIRECEEALGSRGRVIVRYSGTEPKIRLLVEAGDEGTVDTWMVRLTEVVEEEIGA
ncbi:MAG: phosphoglucosamine mutase [Candidatus Pacebacteria bacterium]|nr:phosphoglucosamine mutase [Candidatus Paceibacterota bacterium]